MMIIPSPPPGERARVRGRPRLRGHQLGDPEQVVGGGDEVSGELRALLPSESGLPEARDGLRPAEDLFDPLPDSLAYLVAGVANRPPVHRGAPPLVAGLRDVRRDSPLAASSDEVGGVVAGVSSESDARGVRYVLVEQRQRADALAVARGWVDAKVDDGRSFGSSPFGRKLFTLAHASMSVPSTVKCSSLIRFALRAVFTISARNFAATSCSSRRCRFREKVEWSKLSSTPSMSRNQRNSRL